MSRVDLSQNPVAHAVMNYTSTTLRESGESSAIAEAGTISPRANVRPGSDNRAPARPLHVASRTYICQSTGVGERSPDRKEEKRRKEGLIVALVGK
jgi:hypothetical protein